MNAQRFGTSIAKVKVNVGQEDRREVGVGWKEGGVSGSPKRHVGWAGLWRTRDLDWGGGPQGRGEAHLEVGEGKEAQRPGLVWGILGK